VTVCPTFGVVSSTQTWTVAGSLSAGLVCHAVAQPSEAGTTAPEVPSAQRGWGAGSLGGTGATAFVVTVVVTVVPSTEVVVASGSVEVVVDDEVEEEPSVATFDPSSSEDRVTAAAMPATSTTTATTRAMRVRAPFMALPRRRARSR